MPLSWKTEGTDVRTPNGGGRRQAFLNLQPEELAGKILFILRKRSSKGVLELNDDVVDKMSDGIQRIGELRTFESNVLHAYIHSKVALQINL